MPVSASALQYLQQLTGELPVPANRKRAASGLSTARQTGLNLVLPSSMRAPEPTYLTSVAVWYPHLRESVEGRIRLGFWCPQAAGVTVTRTVHWAQVSGHRSLEWTPCVIRKQSVDTTYLAPPSLAAIGELLNVLLLAFARHLSRAADEPKLLLMTPHNKTHDSLSSRFQGHSFEGEAWPTNLLDVLALSLLLERDDCVLPEAAANKRARANAEAIAEHFQRGLDHLARLSLEAEARTNVAFTRGKALTIVLAPPFHWGPLGMLQAMCGRMFGRYSMDRMRDDLVAGGRRLLGLGHPAARLAPGMVRQRPDGTPIFFTLRLCGLRPASGFHAEFFCYKQVGANDNLLFKGAGADFALSGHQGHYPLGDLWSTAQPACSDDGSLTPTSGMVFFGACTGLPHDSDSTICTFAT